LKPRWMSEMKTLRARSVVRCSWPLFIDHRLLASFRRACGSGMKRR
jgi:hypothetical protein